MERQEPPPPYTPLADINSFNNEHQNYSRNLSPNTIPRTYSHSIEDDLRPLPRNWIKQYDPENHCPFFVDTSSYPPRSIWHHPNDDARFLSSLSNIENTQHVSQNHNQESHFAGSSYSSTPNLSSQRRKLKSETPIPFPIIPKLYRKLKDIFTNSTHEERFEARKIRDWHQREAYNQRNHLDTEMEYAMQIDEPQYLGRDAEGRDVWVERPTTYGDRRRYRSNVNRAGFGSTRYSFNNRHGDRRMNRSWRSEYGSSRRSPRGSPRRSPYGSSRRSPYSSSCSSRCNSGELHMSDERLKMRRKKSKNGYSETKTLSLGLGLGVGMLLGGFLFE